MTLNTLLTFCPLLDGSDNSLHSAHNDSTDTLADLESDHVPSLPEKDEDTVGNLAPTVNASQDNSQQCDDNQNNMNNRMVSNGGVSAATAERIRVNLKQLLALYAKLKRQLVEFTEAKADEQSSYKAKCDEMSSQVRMCSQ